MRDVIHEMSSKRLGMTCVVDGDGRLLGVFTDGDLRRQMTRTPRVLDLTAGDVMNRHPITIEREPAGRRGAANHGNAQDHLGHRRRRRREGRRRRASPRSVAHADDLALAFAVRDVHVSDLNEKASRIRLLLFDVDGVLTDGVVVMHADGIGVEGLSHPGRRGHRLGAARRTAGRAALRAQLGSDQPSGGAARRSGSCYKGFRSKLAGYEQILRTSAIEDAAVAYMGDDLLDLPVIARVGLSGAPADAAAEVRDRVRLGEPP